MYHRRETEKVDSRKLKVGLSSSKKICVICLIEKLLKMIKNAFYFMSKALFVLKIFKFFGHVGKTAWLERQGQLQNSWRRNLVYKQLQYTYCPISYKVMLGSPRDNDIHRWNFIASHLSPKVCCQSIPVTCTHSVLISSPTAKRFYYWW